MDISLFAQKLYRGVLRPKPIRRIVDALVCAMIPQKVTINGRYVYLNKTDPVVSGAITLGIYELMEQKFFRRTIREGMRVLDIGANVGFFSALADSLAGSSGRVDSLEPEPESCSLLRRTADASPSKTIFVHNVAAARKQGDAMLFVSQSNRGDNRLYQPDFDTQSVKIQTRSVDEMVESKIIEVPNFIKIDVQGYEGEVFAGMEKLLHESSALTILFEFWPMGLQSAGADPLKVLADLAKCGYKLSKLDSDLPLAGFDDFKSLVHQLPGEQYTNLVAQK